MKKFLQVQVFALSLFSLTGIQGNAQDNYLVSSELIISIPDYLLSVPPFLFGQYDIDYYKITYNTVDVNGLPTVASGAVAVPMGEACDVFPMLMYCHGTVLRKQDVPSANNTEALIPKTFAGQGFISIAPDYLGLGDNPGLHPYVHAQSQATASVDIYFAAREFIESLENSHHNGELFITGYSQGGHASMATLKYAQDNNLVEEMGIVAGAPSSGPYNMSGSQAEVLLSGEPYSNPGYVVYLLMSYQLAYGNLYADLSEILQSPYGTTMLPYFDGMQNEFDMDVVNALLPETLSELLQDSVLSNLETNDNHPIWQALRDNDNFDWTPQMPLRLFYCDGDEQVPFANSIVARDSMQANGAADVEVQNVFPGANHGQCVIPAVLAARSFFSQLASPCGLLISTTDSSIPSKLESWPNPSSDHVRFSFPENTGTLSVFDMYGKLVAQRNVNSNELNLQVSQLAAGVYIAIFNGSKQTQRASIVVE
jgi:acetyl esterase/lipase